MNFSVPKIPGTKKKDDDGEEGEGEGEEGADNNQGGDAGGDANASGGGGVGEMKSGDYLIHVFVEKLKEINVPENTTCDPMVTVECLGSKEFSSAKDDIGGVGEVVYSEHLFLEAKNCDKEKAESGKILIKVMDKGMFKDCLIGEFEFDMSFIYFKKDHVMLHQWIALSNPHGDNWADIAAYMKVSISVSCTGDEQTQITEDESLEEDTNVIMSPALNPSFYQIRIKVFGGCDLPMMDASMGFLGKEKIDAYLKMEFKGKKFKTKIIQQERGGPPCMWNTEFWLPAQIPVMQPKITMRLMDSEDIGYDETAGSITLDTKEIIELGENDDYFVWKNIYGSPLGQSSSSYKTTMNEEPEFASTWKGRVLMLISAVPTDKPLSKQIPITDEAILAKAEEILKPKKYSIKCQIGQCVALPSKNKYTVKVTVGDQQMEFKPFDQKNASNYKRYQQYKSDDGKEQLDFESSYTSCSDFGYVIFQLMDGKYPVCYYMEPIKNFLYTGTTEERLEQLQNTELKNKWVQWLPDQSVGKVRQCHKAGLFSFKFAMWNVEKDGEIDFKKQAPQSWKKVAMRSTPVKIRAYIYLCLDLPAADAEGTSDPFLVIWDTVQEEKKTDVVEDNNNPLFYETIELDYEVDKMNDLESYPPFIIDVYDHDDDLFDSTPDFLGRAIIEPEDCAIKMYNGERKDKSKEYALLSDEQRLRLQFEKCYEHGIVNCDKCVGKMLDVPDTPRWHCIHYAPGEPKCGQILVSFSVAEHDFVYGQPAADLPLWDLVDTKEMKCNLLILGLRSLQSPGILPVKKAFINFNIKSLVSANGPALKNIQTQPQAPGSNPTLNTTMCFTIPLPTDPLYCPKLGCTVFDYIYKGWNQPVIGNFVLPLGDLMLALKAEREEETSIIEDICQKLEDILNQDPNLIVKSYNASAINSTLLDEDDYSDDGINKVQEKSKKQRKKAEKAFKKVENAKDLNEQLGANENLGNLNAIDQKEAQISSASQLQSQLQNVPGSAVTGKSGTGAVSDTFRSGVDKKAALAEFKKAETLKKRIKQDEKLREMEELNAKGDVAQSVVVMPQYKRDERLQIDKEIDAPPKSLFIGLGWDEDASTQRKHYRQFYDDELEFVTEIFPNPSPFNTYEIHHGVAKGNNDKPQLFSNKKAIKENDSNNSSPALSQQVVGYFKGIVEIEATDDKENYQAKKKMLIDDLKSKINKISMQQTGKPLLIDTSVLGNPAQRNIMQKQFRKIHIDHLHITKHLSNLESDEIIKRNLLAEKRCMIRVYVISAFGLQSRDNGSASDPYLLLQCNGKTFNERDNYQLDNSEPDFFKKFEFEGKFPGTSPLQIDVWDYDMVFGDDLIGTSILDLEDRYFSMEWNGLVEKPIEYRQIYHPSTSISQGTVKMWVEIDHVNVPAEMKKKEWDISPKPPVDLELRVCVLNCKDIPMMDAEGTVDAFCRGYFDTKEDVQETDTHFRCQDGKPDFEYRLVYDIQYPRKNYKYTLQIYDRDFFTANELIGEFAIDLKQLMEDCTLIKKPMMLNKEYYDEVLKKQNPNLKLEFDKSDSQKLWLPMMTKKDGKIVQRGSVRVQIDLIPKSQSLKNPVGKARDNPNHSPPLPQPEGRMELSLNPIKMLNQLVGPALRRKIKIYVCLILCCALFIAILPNILGGLVTKIILGD